MEVVSKQKEVNIKYRKTRERHVLGDTQRSLDCQGMPHFQGGGSEAYKRLPITVVFIRSS